MSSSILTNADRYECTWLDETPKSEGQGEPGQIDVAGHLPKYMMDRQGMVYGPDGVAPSLLSRDAKGPVRIEVGEPKAEVVGELNIPTRFKCVQQVYDRDGLFPTICAGDGRVQNMPKVEEPSIEVAGKLTHIHHNQGASVYDAEGVSPALLAGKRMGDGTVIKIEEPGIEISGLLKDTPFEQAQRVYDPNGCAPSMKARDFKEPTKISEEHPDPGQDGSGTIVEGSLNMPGRYESALRVYGTEGTAPTLPTGISGGGIMPKILEEPESEPKQIIEGRVNMPGNYKRSCQVHNPEGISPCMTAGMGEGGGTVPKILEEHREGGGTR